MKHPALRVADFHTVTALAPSVVSQIKTFLVNQLVPVLPFAVTGVELTGSYARGAADFHSDFDLNIATGSEAARQAALATLRAHPEQVATYIARLRQFCWQEFGVFVDPHLEAPAMKDISVKRCYDFLTGQWYNDQDPNTKKRWDWNETTRAWFERIYPPHQARYSFGGYDTDGSFVVGLDSWASVVPTWRQRYGVAFLEVTTSPETA